jgi:uncharacterized membrane protein HdeD (DUF308 family)
MGDRVWDRPIVRILLVLLGFAGILLGFFLLAASSFADGSTGERVVTIMIALAIMIGGVLLIRSAVS